MSEEIILKIHELGASTNYGKTRITAEPMGDMLYAIKVEPEHFQTKEDGTKVFTVDGIRHILKGLLVSLVIDKDDF